MNKKNLAIFTVARSDFGIMQNIIYRSERDKRFNLYLIIGSAHKSKIFGKTFNEINSIKIRNKTVFKFGYSKSSKKAISKYFNKTLREAKLFFKKNRIDAALILGDRYEMLAISIACLNYNIPIVHFCGGSKTLGSLDDVYRYCISKIATVHLIETDYHKKNLTKIGVKKNVNVVGAPALETIKKNLINKEKLIKNLKLPFDPQKKIVVACFNPETKRDKKYNIKNLKVFLNFLLQLNENLIITYPNADVGFTDYIKMIKRFLAKKENTKIIKSLGIKNYFSLLKFSSILIGNSSSGIIESASFKIPTINLGQRQNGRLVPRNVIHSKFTLKEIRKSFIKASSKKFISGLKKIKNPYFKKNTSKNSLDLIYKYLRSSE